MEQSTKTKSTGAVTPSGGHEQSLANVPYHHNLDLQQIFDTCRVYVAAVEQSLQAARHRPVLSRRLDAVDEALKSISEQFCSTKDVPDEASYVFILLLQKLYELLRQHVHVEGPQVTSVINVSPSGNPVVLTVIPHGQVHVSLEKLVEALHITNDTVERTNEFVYRLHRRIMRSTTNTSPLERVVSAAELWTDQLRALAIYSGLSKPKSISASVQFALSDIEHLLEMREIRYLH